VLRNNSNKAEMVIDFNGKVIRWTILLKNLKN
jgi:hypothetical protein